MTVVMVLAVALCLALICIAIMDGAYSDLRHERDALADELAVLRDQRWERLRRGVR